MLLTSDPLYKECCAILRGQHALAEREIIFCDWVASELDIKPPIHIVAETNSFGRHYLHIVVRSRQDAESCDFRTAPSYQRGEHKQALILRAAKKTGFLKEVGFVSESEKWWHKTKRSFFRRNMPDRHLHDWYVTYSAFDGPAKAEALYKVRPTSSDELVSDFSKDGLMPLTIIGNETFMMFETEAQRIEAEQNGTQRNIAQRWHEMVMLFDEFDVLSDSDLYIKFGSDEVFQRDYNGSWFDYIR